MNLVWTHAKWMILDLLRQPAYMVGTVALPALFYVIFAIPESNDVYSSNLLFASFSCFAVFGVFFLQFGVGVAQERTKTWYHYLRTLPVSKSHLILARFLCAYFFGIISVLALIIIASFYSMMSLTTEQWGLFFLGLFGSGIVFCVMGLCLGYWSTEKTALPVGNLIYLPLSFAGGLWKPPSILPEMLKDISPYLPTRQYGEIVWNIVADKAVPNDAIVTLLVYLLLFCAFTYIGFKRDYNMRLR